MDRETPPLRVVKPVTVRFELKVVAPVTVMIPVEAMDKSLVPNGPIILNDSEVEPKPPTDMANLDWALELLGRKVKEAEEVVVEERIETLAVAEAMFKT